jgi:membrane associated rhomboid family serine protease
MKTAGGVAIAAHLGGFAAGIVLTPIFKHKKIKLFQKANSRAFSRKSRRI